MLVYGDATRLADPRAEIEALRRQWEALAADGAPIERHARMAAVFIAASELAQGLADAAMVAAGGDGRSAEQDAAAALLVALAGDLLASWNGLPSPSMGDGAGMGVWIGGVEEGAGGASGARSPGAGAHTPTPAPPPSRGREGSSPSRALDILAGLPLPASVQLKSAEGYAFYALYPEAYAEAARQLTAGPNATIIGIRSIGLGLAAIVAAAMGAEPPISVRPVGHPFLRRLALTPDLEAELRARAAGRFVIVDEGPGLSGSSFGAVADALEALGVARERIAFLPGHPGDLGPQASEAHRARWATAARPCVCADQLILDPARPGHHLASWFGDLTARAPVTLRDLSGGPWRALRYGEEASWPAADTFQERRKFRLEGGGRPWLLKFAGLGAAGERAFDHARRLAAAGFSPSPQALRYGFIAYPWIEAEPFVLAAHERSAFAAHLGRYLGWRAAQLPAPDAPGAALEALLEMARVNAAEALGEAAADAPALTPALWAEAPPPRRVWTDNRLHAREWLARPGGGWLKTDAVEHASAHDLIGAQDIAWDVAGARVEFDLDASETAVLLQALAASASVDPALVALLEPAYLAFQLGAFTMAADAHGHWPAEQARLRRAAQVYRARLASRLGIG